MREAKSKRQRNQPQKSSGAGAAIAGMGLLFILCVIVVVGIMATKGVDNKNKNTEIVEKRDPFEGLEREEYMVRKAPKSRGFSGKSFDSEAVEWVAAKNLQSIAAELHAEAETLRTAGDSAWHEKAKEAKALYEEALEKGRAYRVLYAGEFGESSLETERIDATLNTWTRTLVGLHKTAGA